MEHERKFIPVSIAHLDLASYPCIEMLQGYIDDGIGTRVRKETSSVATIFTRTIKRGEEISREEDETEITKEEFEQQWSTVRWSLEKKRFYVPLESGDQAEVNIFQGKLSGYVHIEVEFDTADHAVQFVPPHWFGVEVTTDQRHNNIALAKNGIPD